MTSEEQKTQPEDKKKAQEKGSIISAEMILQLKQEVKKKNNDILLEQAENENLRKRMHREMIESNEYTLSNLAKDIIESLDDFYRALASIKKLNSSKDQDIKAIAQGLELTQINLEKNLSKHGIKRHHPYGEQFDYTIHEAISQIINNKVENNKILEVIQAGYSLNNKVLRSAKVIVAKNK